MKHEITGTIEYQGIEFDYRVVLDEHDVHTVDVEPVFGSPVPDDFDGFDEVRYLASEDALEQGVLVS